MRKLLLLCLCLPAWAQAQWSTLTQQNTPICTATAKQVDPRMMDDGQGGAFITWKDYRPSNALPDIYVQRVDAYGHIKWVSDGIALCSESHDQSTPAICSDMKGGAIIAWSDWRSSIERDLYAQRIDSNGHILWTIDGANISNLSNREHSEKIVSDAQGGAIIIFEKQMSGIWQIWAQRLDSAGNKMWGAGGIPLAPTSLNQRNHRVSKDRNGGAIISWQDNRNLSDYDIYAQRVDASGNLLWGSTGKPIVSVSGDQINAKIDPDSIGNGAIIAWQDTRASVDDDIYMQKVDSNGNPLWALNGIAVCNASGKQTALDFLTIDQTGETIITWKDNRNGNYDIYAQKISAMGQPYWMANGVIICNATYDQINPNICTDQQKGAIITWQDSTQTSEWDIKAQRINNQGVVQWTSNGITVCNALFEQSGPKHVSDGKSGAIICWQDKRSGTSDIYAHHINADGSSTPLSTSYQDITADVTIYPNPTNHTVYINLQQTSIPAQVYMYNMYGQLMYQDTIHTNHWPIDMLLWPQGMYMLRIDSRLQQFTKRILKQ